MSLVEFGSPRVLSTCTYHVPAYDYARRHCIGKLYKLYKLSCTCITSPMTSKNVIISIIFIHIIV